MKSIRSKAKDVQDIDGGRRSRGYGLDKVEKMKYKHDTYVASVELPKTDIIMDIVKTLWATSTPLWDPTARRAGLSGAK
ncbi:hypothetical protein Hypma_004437 [Hypsizygus marmoreus]|uniref:Uncharacterized protein n=1 Tax=Hypsizygus marmoreus TaxID=39966 RepID=A0A369K121_HYPMA|nr:hypothetical protein Hypma_004437 [Hypsizygus marmoreus]